MLQGAVICVLVCAAFTGPKKRGESSYGKRAQLPTQDQIKYLIDDIKGIRDGAFQPFLEQPLVRASILLVGAIGLSMGEYFTVPG